jgi:hypothetical protein
MRTNSLKHGFILFVVVLLAGICRAENDQRSLAVERKIAEFFGFRAFDFEKEQSTNEAKAKLLNRTKDEVRAFLASKRCAGVTAKELSDKFIIEFQVQYKTEAGHSYVEVFSLWLQFSSDQLSKIEVGGGSIAATNSEEDAKHANATKKGAQKSFSSQRP